MNNSDIIDDDPDSAKMLGILYAVYAILGIPTNLLVLILTVAVESVRIVPLNICIFSLAFTDMMVLASFLSSSIYAITFDVMICKVMGVGVYVFIVMSMLMPACLAVCRHASICGEHELHPSLRPLKTKKGILLLNALFWTYGLLFSVPYIISDKFGLDRMGCCGIAEIDSAFLWIYYMVVIVGPLFVAYGVSLTFYRKLGRWVKETSSLMLITPETQETLIATRSMMRMLKWVLLVPVLFYYPGLTLEAVLRIVPDFATLRTARIFMITVPLPHVIDPVITLIFVKRYRVAALKIFKGKGQKYSHTAVLPSSNVNN